MATLTLLTNRRDRLHELVLFQLEEDGGFAGAVQPQSHHADLHLGTDVDPVVLEPTQRPRCRTVDVQREAGSAEGAYLGEGDRDPGVQLDVVGELGELVLLLLERLQQTADLLLGQHDPAVVLRRQTGVTGTNAAQGPARGTRLWNFLPVEVFFHSAGRRWTPETAEWSCPPAAASARSAAP